MGGGATGDSWEAGSWVNTPRSTGTPNSSSPAIREGEYRKEFSLDNENTRTSISRVKQATSKVKCLPTQ